MTNANDIWPKGSGRVSEEQLLAYMEGTLNEAERREVELWLSEEGMESDAYDGLAQIAAPDRSASIARINTRLRKKLKKKKRSTPVMSQYYPVVAVLLVVLFILASWLVYRLCTISST
jgi:anti-sigma factor RsiW